MSVVQFVPQSGDRVVFVTQVRVYACDIFCTSIYQSIFLSIFLSITHTHIFILIVRYLTHTTQ